MADKPRGVAAPDSVIADKPPGVGAPDSVITDKPLDVGVPDEIEADPRPYVTSAAPGRPLLASRGYQDYVHARERGEELMVPGLGGRVALVTGVNNPSGIGAAAARALAAEGAAVFATYLRLPAPPEASLEPGEAHYRALSAQPADHVVAAIRASGGRVEAWEVDLAEPSAIPELMDRAERAFGPVEILVHSAAVCEPDTFLPAQALGADSRAADGFPLRTIAAESHDRHFAVNGRATALLMAELARRHIARGGSWGRIVNVSTDGASGFATSVSYGASKHALESYSRAAAAELARFGITVNVVSLGPVQTGWITPELERQIVSQIPLGRVGTPEEVASVIVFLASEAARWLTGQILHVGGGKTMAP